MASTFDETAKNSLYDENKKGETENKVEVGIEEISGEVNKISKRKNKSFIRFIDGSMSIE